MGFTEILNATINELVEATVNKKFSSFNHEPSQRYLNITETSVYLKMSRAKFWKLRKSGKFTVPIIVIDDMQAYDRNDLDKFMEEHKI